MRRGCWYHTHACAVDLSVCTYVSRQVVVLSIGHIENVLLSVLRDALSRGGRA